MNETRLQKTLDSGGFAITAELAPPKGTDFSRILSIAESLKNRIDAVNVTDFQSASVKASSLGLCIELVRLGLDPVLQMTGRDRNRIAIQGELLSAAHFGIKNILCLTGDHPVSGDNPQAKPVFELGATGILQTAETLMSGKDLGGNDLEKPYPYFYLGAVVSPVYNPIELQLIQMEKKIKAGAKFFQTQGIFDISVARSFHEQVEEMDTKVLFGIIPLKSAGMARFMNRSVPGIDVPQKLIKDMENASDPKEYGLDMAVDLIKGLKEEKLCNGVHIMAIGSEENVAKILDKLS